MIWSGIADIWLENEADQLASLQSRAVLKGARARRAELGRLLALRRAGHRRPRPLRTAAALDGVRACQAGGAGQAQVGHAAGRVPAARLERRRTRPEAAGPAPPRPVPRPRRPVRHRRAAASTRSPASGSTAPRRSARRSLRRRDEAGVGDLPDFLEMKYAHVLLMTGALGHRTDRLRL